MSAGTIVPALPEKNVVEKYKMNADFIEQRRAALTVFINRVVGAFIWLSGRPSSLCVSCFQPDNMHVGVPLHSAAVSVLP